MSTHVAHESQQLVETGLREMMIGCESARDVVACHGGEGSAIGQTLFLVQAARVKIPAGLQEFVVQRNDLHRLKRSQTFEKLYRAPSREERRQPVGHFDQHELGRDKSRATRFNSA